MRLKEPDCPPDPARRMQPAGMAKTCRRGDSRRKCAGEASGSQHPKTASPSARDALSSDLSLARGAQTSGLWILVNH